MALVFARDEEENRSDHLEASAPRSILASGLDVPMNTHTALLTMTVIDQIATPDLSTRFEIPLVLSTVSAGFPSPADDDVQERMDLNSHLVRHPASTFFVRVSGDSMIEAGIHSGDLLVVDRALSPADGKVVIAVLDGELTVKRLHRREGRVILVAANPLYPPIAIKEGMSFDIWGVVTSVIHPL